MHTHVGNLYYNKESFKSIFILYLNLLGKNENVLLIYDSYQDNKDRELFLCKTSESKLKWIKKKYVPKGVYNEYMDKIVDKEPSTCNTDKEHVYSCPIKCKTRGVHSLQLIVGLF